MLFKNVAGQGVYLYAWDSINGQPRTGDAANITGVVSKDGGADAATATVHPTSIGSGRYWQPLSQAETNANALSIAWTSTTAGVQIEPAIVLTSGGAIPNAVAGTSGGLPLIDSAPLTNLDAAVSTRSSHSAASVWAVGTRTLSAFAFSVDVATVGGSAASVLTPPIAVNVTQLLGQTIPTPLVAGVPIVDIGYALGEVVVTDSSTQDVNVIQWKGVAPNDLVSGKVDANATASLGATAPANWLDANALAADAVSEIQAGLSTLNAGGVRSAVGLASASLDAQLATIAGYIDTEVAAIKAKTDNLPGSPAAVGSAMTLQDGAITSAKVAVGTYTGVAAGWIERMDQLWRRFFKPASRTPTQLRTFADNGTTVQTTQAISDDGAGNEAQGGAA